MGPPGWAPRAKQQELYPEHSSFPRDRTSDRGPGGNRCRPPTHHASHRAGSGPGADSGRSQLLSGPFRRHDHCFRHSFRSGLHGGAQSSGRRRHSREQHRPDGRVGRTIARFRGYFHDSRPGHSRLLEGLQLRMGIHDSRTRGCSGRAFFGAVATLAHL